MMELPPINMTYVSQLPHLISTDLYSNLFNLFIYSIGMVLYTVIIWHFYRNLGKRTLFSGNIEKPKKMIFLHKIWDFISFLFKAIIIFPVISFIWFLVLGGFMLFISKSYDVSSILLMTMTIIVVARITAYYKEDLSKDVSKLIPFALLGVFIVDPSYFSLSEFFQKAYSLPLYTHLILQYLIALVILELALMTLHRIGILREKENLTSR